MDYSSIQEHSPWASSPQHSRTPSAQQEPPSPTPALPPSSVHHEPREDGPTRISQGTTVVENGHIEEPSTPISPQHQTVSPVSPEQGQPHQFQQLQQSQTSQQQHAPQQQQHKKQASRYHGQRSRSRQEMPSYKLQPKITGLERPTRKELNIRFDVYTNLPGYRTTQFRDVRRSHAEFAKLAEHLISANPEAFVPALPPFATSAGVGTDEDDAKMKFYMQNWLSIVFGNDVLMRDDEVNRFIEGDPGYSPVYKRSQPATGVRRKVIKQFAPPPDDTPELQEARPIVKRFYLGSMDAGQKMDRAVKTRRNLGLAEADFGQHLQALTEQEIHPGLKQAYRKLGRTVQAVGDMRAAQGTAEATVLGDPLHLHSADAFIVKETLTNRHILLRDLLQAQQAVRSKLSATDRLKASSSVRRDKVDEAIAALDEARGHENYLSQKAARVTHHLVFEQRAWFNRTAGDLRASIRELVLREIDAERRALATLESVRPDIRAIDASGGLSRLGRESTPAARRATVQASQGPKGDAWSGVPRRADGLDRSISGSFTGGKQGQGGGGGGGGGEAEEGEEGQERSRVVSGGEGQGGEDDGDRVDARNAASRLAASTF